MTALVADASVCVKWFVTEELSAEAVVLLDDRFVLHAPDLLLTEFANAIWRKVQAGTVPAETARALVPALRLAPMTFHSGAELTERALEIGLETGRTVYGCTYLALAEREGIRLVTCDDRFASALAGTPWAQHVVRLRDLPSLE